VPKTKDLSVQSVTIISKHHVFYINFDDRSGFSINTDYVKVPILEKEKEKPISLKATVSEKN